MSVYEGLSAEFPRDAISWRAQSVTQDGTKAMALAYIDARDVMDRLDSVVGFENWQDRYEFHGSRTVCYLSIRIDGEWVTKADGAGDSDVEAEKGAISDALKRAAVKWGIGRYLYHLKSPWVPCESYAKGGKNYWKKWTDDPWKYVRTENTKPSATQPADAPRNEDARALFTSLNKDLRKCKTTDDVKRWWCDSECIELRKKLPVSWQDSLKKEMQEFGKGLKEQESLMSQDGRELNNVEAG